jgi:hypothetical protein
MVLDKQITEESSSKLDEKIISLKIKKKKKKCNA